MRIWLLVIIYCFLSACFPKHLVAPLDTKKENTLGAAVHNEVLNMLKSERIIHTDSTSAKELDLDKDILQGYLQSFRNLNQVQNTPYTQHVDGKSIQEMICEINIDSMENVHPRLSEIEGWVFNKECDFSVMEMNTEKAISAYLNMDNSFDNRLAMIKVKMEAYYHQNSSVKTNYYMIYGTLENNLDTIFSGITANQVNNNELALQAHYALMLWNLYGLNSDYSGKKWMYLSSIPSTLYIRNRTTGESATASSFDLAMEMSRDLFIFESTVQSRNHTSQSIKTSNVSARYKMYQTKSNVYKPLPKVKDIQLFIRKNVKLIPYNADNLLTYDNGDTFDFVVSGLCKSDVVGDEKRCKFRLDSSSLPSWIDSERARIKLNNELQNDDYAILSISLPRKDTASLVRNNINYDRYRESGNITLIYDNVAGHDSLQITTPIIADFQVDDVDFTVTDLQIARTNNTLSGQLTSSITHRGKIVDHSIIEMTLNLSSESGKSKTVQLKIAEPGKFSNQMSFSFVDPAPEDQKYTLNVEAKIQYKVNGNKIPHNTSKSFKCDYAIPEIPSTAHSTDVPLDN